MHACVYDEFRLVKFQEILLFSVIGGFIVLLQIGKTVVMAAEGQLHGPITCGTAYDVEQ